MPRSPTILALLLALPVLLIVFLSLRLYQSESNRIRNEYAKEAKLYGEEALEHLLGPQLPNPYGSQVVRDSQVKVPLHLEFPLTPTTSEIEYRKFLSAPGDENTPLLKKLYQELSPNSPYTTTGLPLSGLVARLLLDRVPETEKTDWAQNLRSQVLQHPSELSHHLLRDLSDYFPETTAQDDLRHVTLQLKALSKLSENPAPVQTGGELRNWPELWIWTFGNDSHLLLVPEWKVTREIAANLPQLDPGPDWLDPTIVLFWKGWLLNLPAPQKNTDERPRIRILARVTSGDFELLLRANDQVITSDISNRLSRLKNILATTTLLTAFASLLTFFAFRKQHRLSTLQSDFVASVSHELRTPVASIGILAERLQNNKLSPEKTAQYHRFISREGQRLGSLVENILDFSRIEKGRKLYHFEPADLSAIIHDALDLIRPRAEEKKLTLTHTVDLPHGFSPALDALAIRQLLLNLLDNALKFTPYPGTITLTTSISNSTMNLVITDTGPGIPEKDRSKVFQRFYRRERNTEVTGAGIGLSLVKHIVEAHQGQVHLEDNPGGGTRAVVQIPARHEN